MIYNEITQHNTLPLYMLQSFLTSINIIFHSAVNNNILTDDLYILILLRPLPKHVCALTNSMEKLENNNSENVLWGVMIDTWILSTLCCVSRCFNQWSPMPEELISRLTNIKNERINSSEICHNFLIDEYGLIETINSKKNNEVLCVPYDQIFGVKSSGKTSAIHGELKLRDSDITSPLPAIMDI